MGEATAAPDHIVRLLEGLAARTPTDAACEVSPAEIFASASGASTFSDAAMHAEAYTLVLGAVPFSGSLPARQLPSDLRASGRSRRLDVVAVGWTLRALKEGGRAVLVVPESMLFAATQAHRSLRQRLLEENALQAVIRLAPGCYKPRTSAAILVLRKGGSTDWVWFYDLPAGPPGRQPRRAGAGPGESAVGAAPSSLTRATVDMIDVVSRWDERSGSERDRPRSAQSFCVPRAEIVPPDFDLGIDRYRVGESTAPVQVRPHEILAEIAGLEAEIFQGIRQLVGMLK